MTNYSDYDEVKQNLPRLAELPFDSDRKLMSTLHCIDGQYVMYTKGALDVILDRTTILTDEEKQDIREANFSLLIRDFASSLLLAKTSERTGN